MKEIMVETPTFSKLVDWFSVLARHVPDHEVEGLLQSVSHVRNAPVEGVNGKAVFAAESSTGKLLQFYIGEAGTASSGGRHQEAVRQLELIDAALHERKQNPQPHRILAPVPRTTAAPAPATPPVDEAQLRQAVRLVYRMTVKREPAEEEVGIWLGHFQNGIGFHEFVTGMHGSEEAKNAHGAEDVAAGKADGDFVMDLYRLIIGRGCTYHDIAELSRQLRLGAVSRKDLVLSFFSEAQKLDAANADAAVHDGLSCWVMGTPKMLSLAEWQEKARDEAGLKAAREKLVVRKPFVMKSEPGVRVSAIASLYKGGDFIEQFMDNITGQTVFDRHCELLIVDANSPENEAEVIRRYADKHPGVRYVRTSTTVGIYEAWNIGAKMAKGDYLTNTNLDDLRREDSLEIQAGALDEMPFVDVVYQDFYYSFDPRLSWNEVAAFGYKSSVPIITPGNMLAYNSPHNAPMWRRSLHDELGYFDAYYKSAGDYDFWLRCLAAGKFFYKINEPHVVYYQNPKGLSTRSDTKGVVEAKEISRKYTPKLVTKIFRGPFPAFAEQAIGRPADAQEFGDVGRYEIVQKGLRAAAIAYKKGAR